MMKLSGAGDLVRSGQAQMAPVSGQLATNYSTFAGGAGPALDTLAGNDRALSTQLDEAARSDRTGRTSSGTVVNGAAADTNGLAPPPTPRRPESTPGRPAPARRPTTTSRAGLQNPQCPHGRDAAVDGLRRWRTGGRRVAVRWWRSRDGWHVDGLFPGRGMPGFDMGQMAKMANVTGPQQGITAPQRRPVLRTQRYPVGAGAANIRAAINRLSIRGITNRGPVSTGGERDDGGVGSGSRATTECAEQLR